MEQILAGKVAIVTGGASGIGKAIAEEFARQGAKVVVADINQKEACKVKGIAFAVKTDVTKPNQVQNLIKKTIQELGRINILINNAGITRPAKILDPAVVDSWFAVVGVDLNGSFLVTEQVVKTMVKKRWKGSIINLTSVHSTVATKNGAHYTAAKAGLAAATRSWAVELGKYGIRVNAIAPGAILNTGMNRRVKPKRIKELSKTLPLGRWGQPEEIAKAALFLVSEEASYITGQELFVDGGFVLTH